MDLDQIHQDVLELRGEVRGGFKEMNGRLRKVEQWRHYIDGARAASSGAFHMWIAIGGVVAAFGGVAAAWVAIASS